MSQQRIISGSLNVVVRDAGKTDPDYLIGPGCRGCIYLGHIGGWPCCDYLWRTGKLRPDEPISKCSVRTGRNRKPSPEGYYYKDEVIRALNIGPGTLNTYMNRGGIKAARVKGYGQRGLLTEAQVIEIAGTQMRIIRTDTTLPEPLMTLRRKAIRAIRAREKADRK